jgi:hypothetical protein
LREINIDGDVIKMTIRDSRIDIGNNFHVAVRILLNCRMRWEDEEKKQNAIDFFRNYAPLFSYAELAKAWKAHEKACKQVLTSKQSAFWNYMDGKRLVRRGKHVIEWRS